MTKDNDRPFGISRRRLLRCAAGAAAAGSGSLLWPQARQTGAACRTFPLNRGWLFGGKLSQGALQPAFNDKAFSPVSLPHCVARLSWREWDPSAWEDVWVYRRHFTLPKELVGQRVFLHFDAVMVGATPVVNGHELPKHLGGYLPFQYEITSLLQPGENVLALAVDSRWSNVPPEGSPVGPKSIDYLEPGGITRGVQLRVVPQAFISDVFAKPVQVLDAGRRLEIACSIDAAAVPSGQLRIDAALMDGDAVVAREARDVRLEKTGVSEFPLTLSKLGNVVLWDTAKPKLYEVAVTVSAGGKTLHDYRTRIGFRDARFEVDGFFLNGKRFQIFGLNRHELFPYVGGAMPRRVQRRDAEILRHRFHCNFVRCSHYPQSEAFLDACDELGLMVWEEVPGWQYVGDEAWQELLVRDVKIMVRRDRNHPSIVIWGVRANESANHPDLYQRTRAAAKALDDSRPSSGTMTRRSTTGWNQDVFAFDDYHAEDDGSAGIHEPLPGVPYMVAEAVGQFDYGVSRTFNRKYRRMGDPAIQRQQAVLHAQAHNQGASHPRCAGVVAWCAFDYGSLINPYEAVKCPGVADGFRIPKLGASFYLAQGDAGERPVIEPDFHWDFSAPAASRPGAKAAIFSNCERLELFVAGKHIASAHPDRANYPHIQHPPFFADLTVDGAGKPELRIDGYVGDRMVLSRTFSGNRAEDQLVLRADDAELVADGSDATRLAFGVADKFGTLRQSAEGQVALTISGPGTIVGDNPFSLASSGGVGAVWIRAGAKPGRIRVEARHPGFGAKSAEINVVPAGGNACAI